MCLSTTHIWCLSNAYTHSSGQLHEIQGCELDSEKLLSSQDRWYPLVLDGHILHPSFAVGKVFSIR